MRPGQQNKRMRGRGRRGPSPLSRTYESNGPDVKVRGTASHIAEKYMQLARDAQSSGDPVGAENYLQHAEHYFRIIAAAQVQNPQQSGQGDQPRHRMNGSDDGDDGDDDTSADRAAQPQRGQGPQPTVQPQQSEQPQPDVPVAAASTEDEAAKPEQDAAPAPAAEADAEANGTQPPKRRRRRTSPDAAAKQADDAVPASSPNGSGEADKPETKAASKAKAETLAPAGD